MTAHRSRSPAGEAIFTGPCALAPRAGRAPTDLRLGGRWSALQHVKNDAIWTASLLALTASRLLSTAALRRWGRALGTAAHACLSSARRTATANVLRAFPDLRPEEARALVRRCFETLGESLGETVAHLHRRSDLPPLLVHQEARAVIEDARRAGRGVVFASAHLGPWERVAAALVAAGVPLVTIARESYDPRFSRLYDRLRRSHGVDVVWRAGRSAASRLVRALREGRVLGVPMDLRSRVPCCQAPFLGHEAPTPIGPARIALRTGAAVVVGTAAPSPEGGLVVTATRIATHDVPRDLPGAVELTRRINAELSRRILALPRAWVWMHERWPCGTGV